MTDYETLLSLLAGSFLIVMLPLLVFTLGITIFLIIAQSQVNKKARRPGWAAIVPYYCNYVRAEIGGNTKPFWIMLPCHLVSAICSIMSNFIEEGIPLLLLLVISFTASIAIFVCFIIITYNLAKSFGYGVGFTVGLLLIPLVFYPILAWNSSTYNGPDGDELSPYNGREHGFAEMQSNNVYNYHY